MPPKEAKKPAKKEDDLGQTCRSPALEQHKEPAFLSHGKFIEKLLKDPVSVGKMPTTMLKKEAKNVALQRCLTNKKIHFKNENDVEEVIHKASKYVAEKKEKTLEWKRFLKLNALKKVMEALILIFIFIFCVTLLLVHIENYSKSGFNPERMKKFPEKMGYGGLEPSLLDLYRIKYRNQLAEATRSNNIYWFFVTIFSLCFYAISRRNEAQDEVMHLIILRRYFHAIALQDLRRYRADADHEDVALQMWQSERQNNRSARLEIESL